MKRQTGGKRTRAATLTKLTPQGAVSAWRQSQISREVPRQVALVAQPARRGHVDGRDPDGQKAFGVLEPHQGLKPVHGQTVAGAERSGEMLRAHPCLPRGCGKRDAGQRVNPNEFSSSIEIRLPR